MSVYQTISETGFVIGHFDPHDVEAEVRDGMILDYGSISKAVASDAADAIFTELKDVHTSAKASRAKKKAEAEAAAAAKKTAEELAEKEKYKVKGGSFGSEKVSAHHKRIQEQRIIEQLNRDMPVSGRTRAGNALAAVGSKVKVPKKTSSKVLLATVPTAAVLGLNRQRIQEKANSARDVRRYRPASLHYDDGFGKAAEEILKDWVSPKPGNKELPIVPKPTPAAAPPPGGAWGEVTRNAAAGDPLADYWKSKAKQAKKAKKKAAKASAAPPPPPPPTGKAKVKAATVKGLKDLGTETATHAAKPENIKLLAGLGSLAVTGTAGAVGNRIRNRRGKGAAAQAESQKAVEAAKAKAALERKAAQNIKNMKIGGGVTAALLGTGLAANALSNRRRRPSYDLEEASKSLDTIEKGPISGAKKVFASATPKGRRLKAHVKSRGASGLAEDAATGTEKIASTVADISGHATRTSRNVKSVIQDINDVKGGNYNTATAAANAKKPFLTTTQKVVGGGALAGGLLIGHNLAGPKPYPYQQQG